MRKKHTQKKHRKYENRMKLSEINDNGLGAGLKEWTTRLFYRNPEF